MKWNKKSNLDEMQELKLLKIESRGCWLAFWGLLIAMAVQQFFAGPDTLLPSLAGEYIVFMCLALYLVIACLKAGIWDRKIPATPIANLIASLIGAAATSIFLGILSYKNYHSASGALALTALYFVIVFIVLFIVMTIVMICYKKKVQQLEREDPSEDE